MEINGGSSLPFFRITTGAALRIQNEAWVFGNDSVFSFAKQLVTVLCLEKDVGLLLQCFVSERRLGSLGTVAVLWWERRTVQSCLFRYQWEFSAG